MSAGEGSGQGPEIQQQQPVVPQSTEANPHPATPLSTEAPKPPPVVEPTPEGTGAAESKPAVEDAQVPEEIRARMAELLAEGRILNSQEKKDLSRLMTEAKASLVGESVEIDATTKAKLVELTRELKEFTTQVEKQNGICMGPYWTSLVKSQSEIGQDLTKILPDSKEQTLFWNNIVKIVEKAKEGLNNVSYKRNLGRIPGDFGNNDPFLQSEELIREQAKNFVEEARSKDPNEIFSAAREELNVIGKKFGLHLDLRLGPANIHILRDTVDTATTPEEKLAWAFVARSMINYTKEHFSGSEYLGPIQ